MWNFKTLTVVQVCKTSQKIRNLYKIKTYKQLQIQNSNSKRNPQLATDTQEQDEQEH